MGTSVEMGCIYIEEERDDFGISALEYVISAAKDGQGEICDSVWR
jgi:hypothetical protein